MKDKQLTILFIFVFIVGGLATTFYLNEKGVSLQNINKKVTEMTENKQTPYPAQIKLTSTAFENEKAIPVVYTCQNTDINPPLSISNISKETKSLAIVLEDPDAVYKTWTHWIVFNINPATKVINANTVPRSAVLGENDFGVSEYRGPCPPIGKHSYIFRLYALDTMLDLKLGADRNEFDNAIDGHVIDQNELTGFFEKVN